MSQNVDDSSDTPTAVIRRLVNVTADISGLSHCGHVRRNNEDHFLVARFGRFLETLPTNLSSADAVLHENETCYGMLVADGMGGHAAGEVASRMAISTLLQLVFETPDWILKLDDEVFAEEILNRVQARWSRINAVLAEEAAANPDLKGLGTTLTVAWNLGPELFVAHAGDSRTYLLRKRQLHRLTNDHTVAQALADKGAIPQSEIQRHRFRNVLTRALGTVGADVKPDLLRVALEDGDTILLCSDGLTDMVGEDLIAVMLAEPVDSSTTCGRLIEHALAAGGRDNVTVTVTRYRFAGNA